MIQTLKDSWESKYLNLKKDFIAILSIFFEILLNYDKIDIYNKYINNLSGDIITIIFSEACHKYQKQRKISYEDIFYDLRERQLEKDSSNLIGNINYLI